MKYSTCGQQRDCDHSQTDGQTFADNDDPAYKQVASITLSSSAPMTASAALLIIDSSIILPVNIHHAAKRHCWGICFVLTLNASSYCSFFSMQLATDLHFFTCLWQLIAVLVHIATSEVMPFNLILKTEAAWLHLSLILSSRSTSVAVKTWSLTSLYQQRCAAHEQG